MLAKVEDAGKFGVIKDLVADYRGKGMMQLFGIAVGGVSCFGGIKHSKVNLLTIYADSSPPALPEFVPIYADEAGRIVRGLGSVLLIFRVVALPEILDSVISSIPVDMIKVFRRKFAERNEPSKSMSKMPPPVKSHRHVAIRRHFANFIPIPRWVKAVRPIKFAGFRVVPCAGVKSLKRDVCHKQPLSVVCSVWDARPMAQKPYFGSYPSRAHWSLS